MEATIRRKVNISYNWTIDNGTSIPERHIEALEEDAMERITYMMKEGYTSGELCTSVRYGKDEVPEEDEEEGLNYSGWWHIEKTNP